MKVVTWSTPSGDSINLTKAQERRLTKAGRWPRNAQGDEYCQVSFGLHAGEPETEATIQAFLKQPTLADTIQAFLKGGSTS